MSMTVEALAQELSRVDPRIRIGGAMILAEQIMPFIERHLAAGQRGTAPESAEVQKAITEINEMIRLRETRSPAIVQLRHWADLIRRLATPQPPKPAADVPLPRYGFPHGIQDGASPQPMNDGYWTPWHVADLVIAGLRKEIDAREAAGRADAVPAVDIDVICPNCERPTSIHHCQACGADFAPHSPAPLPQQPAAEGAQRECSFCGSTKHVTCNKPEMGRSILPGAMAEPAATAPQMTTQGEAGDVEAMVCRSNDLVLVPRGLLGSACSAIDKKRDAPKTLEALRAITMSRPAAPVADAEAQS